MRNIEIKLRVENLDAVTEKVAGLADQGPELLIQEDVYFDAPNGRLKLRTFANGNAELISYRRSDTEKARESRYLRYEARDPDLLQATLAMAIGQSVSVRKQRLLYSIGQTRVHLDQVESLGSFVELEVVMDGGQPESEGLNIAADLIEKLGLESSQRIPVSYCDLLRVKQFETEGN